MTSAWMAFWGVLQPVAPSRRALWRGVLQNHLPRPVPGFTRGSCVLSGSQVAGLIQVSFPPRGLVKWDKAEWGS